MLRRVATLIASLLLITGAACLVSVQSAAATGNASTGAAQVASPAQPTITQAGFVFVRWYGNYASCATAGAGMENRGEISNWVCLRHRDGGYLLYVIWNRCGAIAAREPSLAC